MKKILITIILAFTFLLTGCGGCASCNGAPILSYGNGWLGDQAPIAGFKEELTYDVKLDKNLIVGDTNFKSNVSKSVLDCDAVGTYKVTTEIILANDVDLGEYTSNVLNNVLNNPDTNADKTVIKITTELNLDFSYKYGSVDKTNNDKIITKTYLLGSDSAFAPIYSETSSLQTRVSANKTVAVQQQHIQTISVYNNTKVNTVINFIKEGVEAKSTYTKEEILKTEKKSTEYTYKSAIDNTSLLFATRSVVIGSDTVTMPVYTPSYDKVQNINMAKASSMKEKFTIGANAEEELSIVAFSLSLNTTSGCTTGKNTGRSQLVFLNAVKNPAPASLGSNRTLVMKYVEPLIEYGGYNSIGALVYKLNNIA